MKPIVCEHHVAAPPARVFDVATDFRNGPAIVPALTNIEMPTPGPIGVGTRFRETRVMFGKEATETMEITAFEPPRGFSLGRRSCGAEYASRFQFEPDGGGTKMTLTFECKPVSFWAKLMSPLSGLMSGVMKKRFEGDLAAIKSAVEKPV
jgi:hypothetical protein